MSIIRFAAEDMQMKLTSIQHDMLMLLVRDPKTWKQILKPVTEDVKQVLEVYEKWEERLCKETVNC